MEPAFLENQLFSRVSPELTALIARHDWEKTPLGPISSWSPTLRSTVEHVLASGFGLLLWWGPDYIQIYNDAYKPVLGDKHPRGLGIPAAQCWSEIIDVIGPLIDKPFYDGIPSVSEDLALALNRTGRFEETHFTVAYSPVPDPLAERGIGGVLATVHETTSTVINERRIRLLGELGTAVVAARTPDDVCRAAAQALATDPLDVPFAMFLLRDAQGAEVRLVAHAGRPPAEPLALGDVSARFATLPPTDWGVLSESAVVLAIPSTTELPWGFLVVGLSPQLAPDDTYRNFLRLVAAPVATAITNAHAYEAERARAEALAELDRAKIDFFSNVSHEFRTPLTLMLGPLAELARTMGPDQHELIDSAQRNSLRLLRLVNTLLDYSRVESGRMEAAYVPTDLSALTVDLASTFRAAIENLGLRFVVSAAPVEAYVDRSLWEKIVFNLLSNAVKFTQDGEIRVTLEGDGASAILTVADTGIGIAAEEQARIFERFHRVRQTQARSYEGSGIGLALVQELVRLHGGTIAVSSRVGEGSSFQVTIPLGSAHLDPDAIVREPISRHVSNPGPYIADLDATIARPNGSTPSARVADAEVLVVDDNRDLRSYITHILRGVFNVTAVRDGVEALDFLRENRVDIVVSDVMMPRMDGYALLEAVRRDPNLSGVRFIFLSAEAGEEAALRGLRAGADDYVAKPFSAEELIARVRAQLRARRRAADGQRAPWRWFDRPGDATTNEWAFREFADQLPIMLYQHDVDGGLSFTNRRWHETLNLPRTLESHTAAAWGQTIHPDDSARVLDGVSDAIAQRSGYELELRLRPAGGSADAYRWYVANAVPHYDVGGEFRGWNGWIIDVHDVRLREDAERQLRIEAAKGEHELRSLAETIPVIVWTADADGAMTWLNARWYEYTGAARSEPVTSTWQRHRHPEDASLITQMWLHAVSRGEAVEMESRIRGRDGTYRTFLTRALPVYNAGNVVRWYGSTVDIQEHKTALERSQHVSALLQQMFLPAALPVSERFVVDAVYEMAEQDARVGGDWYDAVRLPDGRYLFSIGDVGGHGVSASAIAVRMRHAILDYAMDRDDPAFVLERANAMLQLQYAETYVTALVAFLDPDGRELTYASAGHPMPKLANADGSLAPDAAREAGPPLGVAPQIGAPIHRTPIAPGVLVVLYTDGLTEFDRDVFAAEAKLDAALARIAADPHVGHAAREVCAAVLGDAEADDDLAVMAIRFTAPVARTLPDAGVPLKAWRFDAHDAHAAQATRFALMDFVRAYVGNDDRRFAIELIVGELLANTVEHAPGVVDVAIDLNVVQPRLVIRDRGPGLARRATRFPGLDDEHGRGLLLVDALADALEIVTPDGGGTEIRIALPANRR